MKKPPPGGFFFGLGFNSRLSRYENGGYDLLRQSSSGRKSISKRKLTDWLTNRLFGFDGVGFNRWLWNRSNDLERFDGQRSKWDKEPDQDRASEVFSILQSDPDVGFPMLINLAEGGSFWAMETLAVSYETGRDIAPDLAKALQWYHRMVIAGSWHATLGYAHVLTKLGYHRHCDEILEDGVKKGYVPAYFWRAWYRLKRSKSRKTYREVQPLLESAASRGHLAAQRFLALYMARGKFGLRHIPRGIRLFLRFTSSASEDWDAQKTQVNQVANSD